MECNAECCAVVVVVVVGVECVTTCSVVWCSLVLVVVETATRPSPFVHF